MNIILNGRTINLEDETEKSFLGYEQLAIWSGRSPDKVLTVVYDISGRVSGLLTKGEKVELHNGMIFNVADTSNS